MSRGRDGFGDGEQEEPDEPGMRAPATVDRLAGVLLEAMANEGFDVEQTEERLDGFTFTVSIGDVDFWLVLD